MAFAARLSLRMHKELKLLLADPPPGVSIPSLSDYNADSPTTLTSLNASIKGPEGTVYQEGVFNITIQIPERYPFEPPNVTFATPIYHPNIDNGGRICLDILNLPPKGAWQPSLNISTVLTSIGLLLGEPNPDDGLMCEASREHKYNRQVFDQKAQNWTRRYAIPGAHKESIGESVSAVNVQEKNNLAVPHWTMTKSGDENMKATSSVKGKLSLSSRNATERMDAIAKDKTSICQSSISQGPDNDSLQTPVLRSSHCSEKENLHVVCSQPESHELLSTIIVADSEESEDDCYALPSSLLKFRRNRLSGRWKASSSN